MPTRAWREPPAQLGFATDRERIAWAWGVEVAGRISMSDLAEELYLLVSHHACTAEQRESFSALPDRDWCYALLAGMAHAVAVRSEG